MRIRILQPCLTHLEFQAGDELHVSALSTGLTDLLLARRVDGQPVAEVVVDEAIVETDEDVAVLPDVSETATVRRGRGQRTRVS